MPVVQFAPFASLVQPAFWHELTRLKIDVLRLSQDSLPLTGAYSLGRSVRDRETGQDVALGCNLSLGADAFDDAPTYVHIAADRSHSPSIQRPRPLRLGTWRLRELQHDPGLQGCRQGRPVQHRRRRGAHFPSPRRATHMRARCGPASSTRTPRNSTDSCSSPLPTSRNTNITTGSPSLPSSPSLPGRSQTTAGSLQRSSSLQLR